jgi:hypothetical protein
LTFRYANGKASRNVYLDEAYAAEQAEVVSGQYVVITSPTRVQA